MPVSGFGLGENVCCDKASLGVFGSYALVLPGARA